MSGASVKRLVIAFVASATAACAYAEPKIIEYAIDAPGKVSMGIFTEDGVLVRTLVVGEQHNAGDYQVSWDGLDSQGIEARPGQYEWRLVASRGFTAEYLVTVGVNQRWEQGDTSYCPWLGNHAGPLAVESDNHGNMVLTTPLAENTDAILKQSIDGKVLRWASIEPGRGHVPLVRDIAHDDRCLLVLLANGNVVALDKSTGEISVPRKFMTEQSTPVVWENNAVAEAFEREAANIGNEKGSKSQLERLKQKLIGRMSIAAGKDFFVVAVENYHELRAFSYSLQKKRVANVEMLAAFKLEKPSDVVVSGTGEIFVISGSSVYFIQDLQSEPINLIRPDDRLKGAYRLAYDARHKHLLIAQNSRNDPLGEDAKGAVHNVLQYTTEGQFVKSFGPFSGRRFQGPYNGEEFSFISDITADGNGGFLVCEEHPRRYAHFDANGALVNEWFGGMPYFTCVVIDPKDPTVGFSPIDNIHLGRVKLDYDKGSWELTHIYSYPKKYGSVSHRQRGLFMNLAGSHHALLEIRYFRGKRYLVALGDVGLNMFLVDDERFTLKPVALIVSGSTIVNGDNGHIPEPLLNAFDRRWAGSTRRGRRMENEKLAATVVWCDSNGDGDFQSEEVSFSAGGPFNYGRQLLDEDMNLSWAHLNTDRAAFYTVPNRNPGEAAPRWDFSSVETTTLETPEESSTWGNSGLVSVCLDDEHNLYGLVKGNRGLTDDRQGTRWPTGTLGTVRMLKWNQEGKLLWLSGKHAMHKGATSDLAERKREPGTIAEPMNVSAQVGEHIVFMDRTAPLFHAYTKDGLFIGNLMENQVADSRPYGVYYSFTRGQGPNLGDVQVANIIRETKHDILVSVSGKNSSPIYRIQDTRVTRKSGQVIIRKASPSAKGEGTGLKAEYLTNTTLTGPAVLTRSDPQIWFGSWYGDHIENSGYTWSLKKSRRGQQVVERVPFDTEAFSSRWSGFIEPRFSEEYTFYFYVSGYQRTDREKVGNRVRLWVDNQLILDEWESFRFATEARHMRTRYSFARPIRLDAGEKIPVKIEYAASGESNHLHFNWMSQSQEPQHVPQKHLYAK